MEKAIKVLEDAVEKADFWIKILDGTPSSSGREEGLRQRDIYNDCKQALQLLRESQKPETSESALPISDVGKQRELLIAFAEKYAEKRKQIGDNCMNADWFVDDFLKGNL